MPTWPPPRSERLGTPDPPAIRFARGTYFGASWFTHLLQPVGLLAPLYGSDRNAQPPGAFTSRLSTDRSPSPLLGMTTTATGLLCWRDLHPLEWQLASLAAPDPYVQLSRIRLPDGPAARRASERAISVHRSDAMLASRRSLVRASSAAFWSFGGPGMLCVESIDISRFCVEATGHHRVTVERRNGGDVGPRGLGEGDRGRHP